MYVSITFSVPLRFAPARFHIRFAIASTLARMMTRSSVGIASRATVFSSTTMLCRTMTKKRPSTIGYARAGTRKLPWRCPCLLAPRIRKCAHSLPCSLNGFLIMKKWRTECQILRLAKNRSLRWSMNHKQTLCEQHRWRTWMLICVCVRWLGFLLGFS